MFLAYKYGKKKYNQRQARLSAQTEVVDGPAQEKTQQERLPERRRHSYTNSGSDHLFLDARESQSHVPVENAADKKRRRIYRYKLIFGLFAPFTLQALDTTIVASALPYIAADFNQVGQLNWIISSFNLTAAAFLPFWAQSADIFGRHTTLQATLIIMMIGSAICTGAPTNTYGVLLLGRALQGIGCAGVNISVRTILADKVSLAEYARNWTVFSVLSAVSFSIGPVIGGYLTSASWRWVFAINLPVAVVAILGTLVLLRKELLGPQELPEWADVDTSRRRQRLSTRLLTFDYGGQMLFLWGLGLVILALTWAGETYSWGSAAVIAPLVIGVVLVAVWLLYEYLMVPGRVMARVFPRQRAMMPWNLLTQRDIGLLFVINFSIGMAMYAVLYFLNLYFAIVQGSNSQKAGVSLLYFLPGLGAGAFSSTYTTNIFPRQTLPSLLFGDLTSAIGVTVLAWATHAGQLNVVYGMMALTGFGVGMRLNAGALHGLAYFPAATAQITCIISFAVPFGGAVALTMMSTVFNNKSGANRERPADDIMWAFVALIPFMWLTLFLSTFLGNVWILQDGGHEVVNGSYLWSLVTGRKLQRERRTRGEETQVFVEARTDTLPMVGPQGQGMPGTQGSAVHV